MLRNTFQGRKTVRDRKILEVHVDKGMTDGQKIVFSGEGDQEPELEAGDLIIVLDEKEHEVSTTLGSIPILSLPILRKKNNDLTCKISD